LSEAGWLLVGVVRCAGQRGCWPPRWASHTGGSQLVCCKFASAGARGAPPRGSSEGFVWFAPQNHDTTSSPLVI